VRVAPGHERLEGLLGRQADRLGGEVVGIDPVSNGPPIRSRGRAALVLAVATDIPTRTIARTTPPSTRRAAPVVAEASGLHT
jgi:hypothetical protein